METQLAPFVVVGLGNPGREYRNTRHNIGFMLIDELCKQAGIRLTRLQSKALVGMATVEGLKMVVAKPQTFMNLSGQSVGGLVRFYKAPLTQLIVAHDDIDLPLGTIRIRPGGGSAGQRGMASIIQQLGTQDFARLRLGVGRPPGQMNPRDYVLHTFTKYEADVVQQQLEQAASAVGVFLKDGLDMAMNRFNGSVQEK